MNKYVLDRALLIYRLNCEGDLQLGDGFYFQEHRIAYKDKDTPVLLEGKPLTKEAIIRLCKSFVPSMVGELTFLDGKVLATSGNIYGPDVWWAPPSVRTMFFTPVLKIKNMKVPWPGLVMAAYGRHLEVFAVKGKERPNFNTRLYMAPFMNMSDNSICLGNADIPVKNNDYASWENALFNSAFSEDRGVRRVKDKSLTIFWRKLTKGKYKTFPTNMLMPCKTPKTVKDLLEDLRERGNHA